MISRFSKSVNQGVVKCVVKVSDETDKTRQSVMTIYTLLRMLSSLISLYFLL